MSKSKSRKKKHAPVQRPLLIYKRLLKYAWRYKLVFLAAVLSIAVLSLSNTAFLAVIKKIMDEGFVENAQGMQLFLPLMLMGLMVVRAISGYASTYSMRVVARRVVEDFRKEMFQNLMHLPVGYFDARSSGELVSKFSYDIERLSVTTTRSWFAFLRDILTVIGLICYMLYLDWKLTLIFAVILPIIGAYLKKVTPKLKRNADAVQTSMGEMTQAAEEAVSGQRIVKIFGAQAYENARFSTIATNNRKIELRLTRISGLSSFMVEISSALALALVIYYAMGNLSQGAFAAFIGALLMLISPLKNIAKANEDFQTGLAAAQSVFSVIDAKQEVDEGELSITRARGDIEFRQVNLQYESAEKPALKQLSLKIKAGEKVALVGRSGGGKTTLVNLLPRFYEYQEGMILLDGLDIRSINLSNLREQFALVSQDIVLFNDTIFNNIAYGSNPPASKAQVVSAAKAANAWEFIESLPDGLDNIVGDRGVKLSGGQRQRIAIARAILKDAPILLLDEATSALDTESEQYVQNALDQLLQNRTSIMIAHRLSTIENADRIFVLDQGQVIESGTHQSLIEKDAHYAKLYHKEFV